MNFENTVESIIDKTSRFVKEEILPLLTIENFKRLASNLNKYIFTPLGVLYGSVVSFFKDLFDGCYDDQIKKIIYGLNTYLFRPLGSIFNTVKNFFFDLFDGKYDKQITKISDGLNTFLFKPLGSLYSSVKNFFRDLLRDEKFIYPIIDFIISLNQTS